MAQQSKVSRRRFLETLVAAPLVVRTPSRRLPQTAPPPFELEEITIASLQDAMRRGRLSAVSVAELYLSRIAQLDKTGPELRSFLELNPDAAKTAAVLDAERKAGNTRGPLHGIPVLLKDNINTASPMTTTAGSLALEGSISPREAVISQRLRAAGALVLGKANMSEWANFRSTRSTSGWSARGGQCRNPYVLDHSPLGSSSGSAVAASANLCAVTVGTETDGSIVTPSSVCGVVGIKPTVGLVPVEGVVPVAHSQDAPGPICRTVTDAAIVLGVMVGKNYAAAIGTPDLKGTRLGVARRLFVPDAGVNRLMNTALDALRALGAELIEVEAFGSTPAEELDVLLYEFKADINAYLGTLSAQYRNLTLRDLIAFNTRTRERELTIFGQEMFELAEKNGSLEDQQYRRALEQCRKVTRAEGIDAALSKYKVEAFVAPTCAPAGPINPGKGDAYLGKSTTFPAVAGYPHITVPAGLSGPLPVGLSFFGGAWSEATLLRIAYAFEQATRFRRVPQFLPSV